MGDNRADRKPQSYATRGEHARRLRERLGLSQAAAADRWGVAERTLRDVESGAGASAGTLTVIAERLDLPHWYDLLTDDELARLGVGPVLPPSGGGGPLGPAAGTRPPVAHRLFQLPAAVPDFTGRAEERRAVAERLRGSGGAVGLSALRGMGGVGKTSLAVTVAHAVRDHFPDAQLFLELDGLSDRPATRAEAMGRVVHAFHPQERLPDREAELAARYRTVLAGRRVLVVLDNAADEAQVEPLVSVPPPAAFLVTSRRALALSGVLSVRVDVLPEGEAVALLRGILGARGSDAEVRELVDLCGRLPLALRVAGDFLRLKEDWAPAEYLGALRAARLRWLKVGTSPDKDVEAVLKLSSAQLVREDPELATRWHLLHVIPADFDAAAAAALWGEGPGGPGALPGLSRLAEWSLVLFDPANRRYRLHDLMRPIAEGLFGPTGE